MQALLPLLLLFAAAEPDPTRVESGLNLPPHLLDIGLSLRFTSRANEPRTWLTVLSDGTWNAADLFEPTGARQYPSALVALYGELEPISGLVVRAAVDTGMLQPGSALEPAAEDAVTSDGRAVADTFTTGAFVRELSVRFVQRSFFVEVGRQHTRAAEGLVYEDFGTGVTLGGSLAPVGLPLRLEASAVAVGHELEELVTPSPLLWLRAEYPLSPFESLGMFGGAFFDRSGALSDLLASSLAEGTIVALGPEGAQEALDWLFDSERLSRGALGYAGAFGNLLPMDGLSLRGAGVFSWGRLETSSADRALAFRLWGWAASGSAVYGVTPSVGVGAIGFGLSGDRAPGPRVPDPTYGAFIGVAPYWSWTGIFFSGGINQGLYPARAAAGGVNGHGVVGGGPTLELSGESYVLTLRAAYLRALEPPPPAPLGGGGETYGVEVDAVVQWYATRWLSVAAEIDVLFPGSYFPSGDVAYRGIGQAAIHVD
jgi:hypothetical protein